jgi:predicted ArsR family transcriptional regulator
MIMDTRLESWMRTQQHLAEEQAIVLDTLTRLGAAAPWQVAHSLGLARQDVAPRMVELHQMNLIVQTEEVRTNPKTGRAGRVWRPHP